MNITSSARSDTKSDRLTIRPSVTSGSSNSGALVPSGSIVDRTATPSSSQESRETSAHPLNRGDDALCLESPDRALERLPCSPRPSGRREDRPADLVTLGLPCDVVRVVQDRHGIVGVLEGPTVVVPARAHQRASHPPYRLRREVVVRRQVTAPGHL